jgi:hypothetical protein
MSTAAHEPRRVGPRRSDSPSGSKVTPRRNAPETSEQHGPQYDSDEFPVLIRLPNLRDIGSVESRPASTTQKKSHRSDRASVDQQKASKREASKSSKRSFQQKASDNKLTLGGIVGGILIVVMLFWFNSGRSTTPADQDGWATEAAALEPTLQEPEISLPTDIAPPPTLPIYAYEAPQTEAAQFASGQTEQAPIGVPQLQPDRTESPNQQGAVAGWPPEEAMGSAASEPAPTNLWPGQEYVPADSSDPTDYQSSTDPSEAETYRMGKRSSILNGNIEIPETTSIR